MGRLILSLFLCAATCSAQQQNDLILIKGGKVTIGNLEQPDAQPLFDVHVADFRMQRYEVTNVQFADFIAKPVIVHMRKETEDLMFLIRH